MCGDDLTEESFRRRAGQTRSYVSREQIAPLGVFRGCLAHQQSLARSSDCNLSRAASSWLIALLSYRASRSVEAREIFMPPVRSSISPERHSSLLAFPVVAAITSDLARDTLSQKRATLRRPLLLHATPPYYYNPGQGERSADHVDRPPRSQEGELKDHVSVHWRGFSGGQLQARRMFQSSLTFPFAAIVIASPLDTVKLGFQLLTTKPC